MDADLRRRVTRRRVLQGLAAASAVLRTPGVRAQGYPDRVITFVTPFTAGSGPDVLVRAFAREVSRLAGVATIVDNKPGASSMLAAQGVAKAPADGHTLLVTGNVAITGNPHVFKKLSYNPLSDFVPVTPLAKGPMVLYVSPRKLAAGTVGELIQVLRRSPGTHTFGYTSITSRLPAEVLQQAQGLSLVGVPYRSGASALPDLVSGQLDLMFTDLSAWPYVASGRLRALAVTGSQRSRQAPDVPTFDEAGVPGMDIGFWIAVYLPSHAPKPVVSRLHQLLLQAARAPEVRAAYESSGTTEFVLPEGELARFQAKEREHWGRIIRAAGIQPE